MDAVIIANYGYDNKVERLEEALQMNSPIGATWGNSRASPWGAERYDPQGDARGLY